jgi:uncharacterized membrane protein
MLKYLSWFGTLCSVIGSFAVAEHQFLLGYISFLVGAIALLICFIRDRNWSMISLQLFFMVANFRGLYNALA